MKSVLSKIFQGFLTGVGFSIALGVAYYYVTQQLTADAMSMYSFEDGTVEITKHKKIERDGKLLILGEVQNNGENQAEGVNIVVDLFRQ